MKNLSACSSSLLRYQLLQKVTNIIINKYIQGKFYPSISNTSAYTFDAVLELGIITLYSCTVLQLNKNEYATVYLIFLNDKLKNAT